MLWHLGRLKNLAKGGADGQLSFEDLDLPADNVRFEPLSLQEQIAWDFETTGVTTGPHPMALHRAPLHHFGAISIEEVLEVTVGSTVLIAGSVISRQRPPTAKGMCFLIVEDETYRIPTALVPNLFARFEELLREPMLLIEGILEGTEEEKRGATEGRYHSVLITKIWSLREVLGAPRLVHGAAGHPGESPRAGLVRVA